MEEKQLNSVQVEQLINTIDLAFHNLEIKTTGNNIQLICVIDNDIKGIKKFLNDKKNDSSKQNITNGK